MRYASLLAPPLLGSTLLSGCVDTKISLDLREPESAVVKVNAFLKPAAIDFLKLSHPELMHGSLEEKGKQLRTCQAFFADDPRAKEVLSSSSPVQRDGVSISKEIGYASGLLNCGFTANGPAGQVLQMVDGSKMVSTRLTNGKYEITLNTRNSEYGNLPDWGIFSQLAQKPEDLPSLQVVVQGHGIESNFEEGLINANRFELQENLLGNRKHFQTEFVVSVKSTPPNLIERAIAGFNELTIWISQKIGEMQK